MNSAKDKSGPESSGPFFMRGRRGAKKDTAKGLTLSFIPDVKYEY
jgi:hypothetical protein